MAGARTRGDAVRGDAVRGDAVRGDAVRGDAVGYPPGGDGSAVLLVVVVLLDTIGGDIPVKSSEKLFELAGLVSESTMEVRLLISQRKEFILYIRT